MKIFYISLICCVLSLELQAQEDHEIVSSFDSIVNSSGSYQDYKVIKKTKLSDFKNELTSKQSEIKSEIESLKENISNFKNEVNALENQNQNLNTELEALKSTKSQINFIGIKMNKSSYSLMVWVIILVLVLLLAFFVIKFRNRNIVNQELKENLRNTDKAFEEYKHKAIEKQQKLGRELLDAKKMSQNKNSKK